MKIERYEARVYVVPNCCTIHHDEFHDYWDSWGQGATADDAFNDLKNMQLTEYYFKHKHKIVRVVMEIEEAIVEEGGPE